MRVSVVVPVYNPGESLHRCVESLLAQSLPAESTELIFVDDGSTDGSGEWLDSVAAEHGQVRVIHEPNSGWAGRPRNVGLDAASGEFVQFVDQDDALGPEALERLTAFGAEHGADIVIGKVTSNFRRVPQELFRHNRARCSLQDTALIRSLTPHKMFRRSFLIDNKLRYGEGKRRLEDQLFMTQAYFATDAVAVLSDYPCYFYLRRDDGGNSAKREQRPADYYRYLREVLDVVEEHTEPGEFRDELHDRFLNSLLHKVRASVRSDPQERFDATIIEIRDLASRYFAPGLTARPAFLRRQLAAAMLGGTPQQIKAAARRYQKLKGAIESVTISRAGADGWSVTATASLTLRDGSPARFRPHGDGWRVDKRLRVAGLAVRPDAPDELLAGASGDLVLRSAATGVEWLGPATLGARLIPVKANGGGAHRLQIHGTVRLDPGTFAAGGPLPPGTWLVDLRLSALGVSRDVPVRREGRVGKVGRRHRRSRQGARLDLRRGRLRLIVPER
jgi:glycosyltransferase involved in cell wall biosynthesis